MDLDRSYESITYTVCSIIIGGHKILGPKWLTLKEHSRKHKVLKTFGNGIERKEKKRQSYLAKKFLSTSSLIESMPVKMWPRLHINKCSKMSVHKNANKWQLLGQLSCIFCKKGVPWPKMSPYNHSSSSLVFTLFRNNIRWMGWLALCRMSLSPSPTTLGISWKVHTSSPSSTMR